jgi:hypothetical protein
VWKITTRAQVSFDRQLRGAGYLAMGGQIVDATLVSAPRQRNTADKKAAIRAGKSATEIWPDKPAKAAQKDVDARWTVKIGRTRDAEPRRSVPELAIPVFGYKNHIAIEAISPLTGGSASFVASLSPTQPVTPARCCVNG